MSENRKRNDSLCRVAAVPEKGAGSCLKFAAVKSLVRFDVNRSSANGKMP